MKMTELRIPEMLTLKSELLEIIEQAYALQRKFMNKIMTELEKDVHERLLHEEMEAYTGCFSPVDKVKILALLDEDTTKLTVKLEKAKKYHQDTVSEIESI